MEFIIAWSCSGNEAINGWPRYAASTTKRRTGVDGNINANLHNWNRNFLFIHRNEGKS
jgi:hypothetical protein